MAVSVRDIFNMLTGGSILDRIRARAPGRCINSASGAGRPLGYPAHYIPLPTPDSHWIVRSTRQGDTYRKDDLQPDGRAAAEGASMSV